MQIQMHVLSGWCVANLLPLTPKERFLAMLAASVADLDGLGIVFGIDAYVTYHHVVGHNLIAAFVCTAILACWSVQRLKCFGLFLALFHLHLILDYYGSGPGWGIEYLWPFSHRYIENPNAWAFNSWQNLASAVVLLLWAIGIARYCGRTPLELVMPKIDRQLVARLQVKA